MPEFEPDACELCSVGKSAAAEERAPERTEEEYGSEEFTERSDGEAITSGEEQVTESALSAGSEMYDTSEENGRMPVTPQETDLGEARFTEDEYYEQDSELGARNRNAGRSELYSENYISSEGDARSSNEKLR